MVTELEMSNVLWQLLENLIVLKGIKLTCWMVLYDLLKKTCDFELQLPNYCLLPFYMEPEQSLLIYKIFSPTIVLISFSFTVSQILRF